MNVNADFSQRAAEHAAELPWRPSPMPGVERRMLDRIGDEVARATSLVRYAPNSAFSAHTHGGGEEFIVLDGVFQDEHGDYPAGSYVRNPPQSSHTPASDEGCTIFVKLWQFDPADQAHVRLHIADVEAHSDPDRPDVQVRPLFRDSREEVRVETWAPDADVEVAAEGGAELFVLGGAFRERGTAFGLHDWLRLPDGDRARFSAGPAGAQVWIKTGHLRDAAAPAAG